MGQEIEVTTANGMYYFGEQKTETEAEFSIRADKMCVTELENERVRYSFYRDNKIVGQFTCIDTMTWWVELE